MTKYLLIFFLLIGTAAMHPFHVSVCEINYDQKAKVMQITQRFFLDDMETAIKQITAKKKLNILDPAFSTELDIFCKKYFKKQFSITVNGKMLDVMYLGHEIEGDAVWCFLETEKVKKIKTVTIKNQLLFETFNDQSNIIHIKINGNTKSLKLTNQEVEGTVLFSD